MDLYVAAMLRRLDLVKGQLEAYPDSSNGRGPHGFDTAPPCQAMRCFSRIRRHPPSVPQRDLNGRPLVF